MREKAKNRMDTCIQIITWLGKLLYHVSPSLVTVVVGSLLIQRFFVRKANIAHLIDKICQLMLELKENCASYWPVNQNSPDKRQDLHILEAKIKGDILQLEKSLQFIAEKYNVKIKNDTELIMDLLDRCTGGGFETAKRKSDKERYLKIVNSVNKIHNELQKIKI
jgi:hypothetical protein